MYLSSFLRNELIFLQSEYRNWAEMISDIIPIMIKDAQLDLSAQDIITLFEERENQQSTAFPAGIAVPHIRLDQLGDPIIATCIPKEPVLINHVHVRMFVIIISDRAASKLYLNLLKTFMGIAKNEELFRNLCNQTQADSFIETIRATAIMVMNEVNVGDIMTTHFKTVSADTNLSRLSDLFYKQQYQYYPVAEQDGRIIGEVSLLNYLGVGVPKYAMLLDHVRFPKTIEPLADIYKQENTLSVREIMNPVTISLDANTSIAEAVYLMVKHQRRLLPVFRDGGMVGILFAGDVFKKLIRG